MSARSFSDTQLRAMAADYRGGMTYRAVAEKYGGGSDVAVRRALIRFGEPSRNAEQAAQLRATTGTVDDDELVRLYRDEHMTIAGLAGHFRVGVRKVSARLNELGVDRRPGGVTHPLFDTHEKCVALAERYREIGNVHALALEYGCSTPTIVRALHRAGQPSVAKGRERAFSPVRGSSTAPYSGTWEALREQVFDRDDRRCRACGHLEVDRSRKLTVAHLVPIVACANTDIAHQLDNLVTLCGTCHRSFDGAYYTEWCEELGDRRFWPAWAVQAQICGDCGSMNVVSVPPTPRPA